MNYLTVFMSQESEHRITIYSSHQAEINVLAGTEMIDLDQAFQSFSESEFSSVENME